jgi:hypothetical protein
VRDNFEIEIVHFGSVLASRRVYDYFNYMYFACSGAYVAIGLHRNLGSRESDCTV